MKIVQIDTYDITGGAARAAYRLHKGLRQIGQDCKTLVKHKASADDSVLCITPQKTAEQREQEFYLKEVIQNHYIYSYRTEISNTAFSIPYPGCDISGLSVLRDADVINLHWVANYQSLVTLKSLFDLGRPVVWTLHDQWAFTGGCHYAAGCKKYERDCVACPQLSDDPFNLPAAILKDKIELFKGADLTIVTPSRWMASCAGESKLFRDLRIEVIPNSLETDIFKPMPKEKAKKNMGLEADTVTLLFGAEYGSEKRKGFRELMAAVRYCLADPGFQNMAKEDRIRILCFGHPGDKLDLAGVPVVSLGYLTSDEEVATAYCAADLFIQPSLEDNLPNTMLEAMSCGTPVVAFDVGGMPDVVINGVTGQLAALGDAREMGEAILTLIFDPDKREAMGQECRRKMEGGYSLDVQARRYLGL
ncbi:MAG: glycosyltransferase family 4 protein, partial [Thermodesulfobacteriota bacterium]|nr:glycosyltransferase family 4 protein [Thermodesulfobacteriota bacterium]